MSHRLFDLEGKTAVVVGGTSGIGYSIALGLAEAGADVVPASRRAEKVREAAESIKSKGRRSLAVTVDATKREEVEEEHVTLGQADLAADHLRQHPQDHRRGDHDRHEPRLPRERPVVVTAIVHQPTTPAWPVRPVQGVRRSWLRFPARPSAGSLHWRRACLAAARHETRQ